MDQDCTRWNTCKSCSLRLEHVHSVASCTPWSTCAILDPVLPTSGRRDSPIVRKPTANSAPTKSRRSPSADLLGQITREDLLGLLDHPRSTVYVHAAPNSQWNAPTAGFLIPRCRSVMRGAGESASQYSHCKIETELERLRDEDDLDRTRSDRATYS